MTLFSFKEEDSLQIPSYLAIGSVNNTHKFMKSGSVRLFRGMFLSATGQLRGQRSVNPYQIRNEFYRRMCVLLDGN